MTWNILKSLVNITEVIGTALTCEYARRNPRTPAGVAAVSIRDESR